MRADPRHRHLRRRQRRAAFRDARRDVAAFATEDTRSHAEVLAPGIEQAAGDGRTSPARTSTPSSWGWARAPSPGLRSGIVTARDAGLRLGQAAVRRDEPGRHRPGSGAESADAARRVHRGHRRPAQGGLLGPLHACRRPAAELLDGPHVGFAAELPDLPVYGAGAGLYAGASSRRHRVQRHAARRPLSLGQFALARLAPGRNCWTPTPLYLRESDAQVPGPRKRAL